MDEDDFSVQLEIQAIIQKKHINGYLSVTIINWNMVIVQDHIILKNCFGWLCPSENLRISENEMNQNVVIFLRQ